jgi:hypothetical protein
MSAFVVLGRIFDQDQKSLHNIDKLLTAVSSEIGTLSKAGLAQRRIVQGMDPQQAAAYVADKYDLTVEDVREMRKAVGKCRRVYEARYREIRHKIFAHKSLSRADADKLMAKTNIEEVKELLGFLHSLYMSLWQLHINGRRAGHHARDVRLAAGAGRVEGRRAYVSRERRPAVRDARSLVTAQATLRQTLAFGLAV